MSTDLRARYLDQRVMTATPGQRIVMLYDRLVLDLTRAAAVGASSEAAGAERAGADGTALGGIPAQRKPQGNPATITLGSRQSASAAAHSGHDGPAAPAARASSGSSAHIDQSIERGHQLDHAMQIIAALAGSLQEQPGVADSPVSNLASLYTFMLGELTKARGGETQRIAAVRDIASDLRSTWAEAVATQTSARAADGVRVG